MIKFFVGFAATIVGTIVVAIFVKLIWPTLIDRFLYTGIRIEVFAQQNQPVFQQLTFPWMPANYKCLMSP